MWEYRIYDVVLGRLAAEVARMYEVRFKPQPDTAAQSLFDLYGLPSPCAAGTALIGPRLPPTGLHELRLQHMCFACSQ